MVNAINQKMYKFFLPFFKHHFLSTFLVNQVFGSSDREANYPLIVRNLFLPSLLTLQVHFKRAFIYYAFKHNTKTNYSDNKDVRATLSLINCQQINESNSNQGLRKISLIQLHLVRAFKIFPHRFYMLN